MDLENLILGYNNFEYLSVSPNLRCRMDTCKIEDGYMTFTDGMNLYPICRLSFKLCDITNIEIINISGSLDELHITDQNKSNIIYAYKDVAG